MGPGRDGDTVRSDAAIDGKIVRNDVAMDGDIV